MKLGLMQGRLLPPVRGQMQEFPENWEDELVLVERLGLVGVEWLLTLHKFHDNPILEKNTFNKFPVMSVCMDNLVDDQIDDPLILKNIIQSCYDEGVRRFTIPLLEQSSMINGERRNHFCNNIEVIGNLFHDAIFSFEAELHPKHLAEIVYLCDNFRVTYDTGNTTSFGLDHVEYITQFSSLINNVHLKDRTFDAETVEPPTGDTDFETIFRTLKSIGYDGNYVIQTARGKTGKEVETILNHMNIFRDIYDAV